MVAATVLRWRIQTGFPQTSSFRPRRNCRNTSSLLLHSHPISKDHLKDSSGQHLENPAPPEQQMPMTAASAAAREGLISRAQPGCLKTAGCTWKVGAQQVPVLRQRENLNVSLKPLNSEQRGRGGFQQSV